MIALLVALVSTALAAGVHAGIPVRGVPGLGEPSFQTPATGWTAPVEGGWVRVYVGDSEALGAEWYTRALATLGVAPAPLDLPGADEAHGDGDTLVGFRDGNVAFLVRVPTGARAIAERLQAAIVDTAPALAPRLVAVDGTWQLDAPGAAGFRAPDGVQVRRKPGVYAKRPTALYVWDEWGRVTVIE